MFTLPAIGRRYVEAYDVLEQRRHWALGGMGGAVPQAFPVTETFAVADEYGLPRRLALRILGAMDDEVRRHHAAPPDDDEP